MGVPNGSCDADEYYDVVTGQCLQCSVVCRNVKKPDSLCLYHCFDFYNQLFTTTLSSLPDNRGFISMPLLVASVLAGVILIVICCSTLLILGRLRKQWMHHDVPKNENYRVKYRRQVRNFRRIRRETSVQETKNPNMLKESELSVLYVSPCSSLPPSSESSLSAKTVNNTTKPKPYITHAVKPTRRVVGVQTNVVTTDAIISSPALESFGSFDETLPKFICYSDQSFSRNNLVG